MSDAQPESVSGEPFGAAEFQAETGAADAAMADMEAYRLLLLEWNTRMNLVGPSAIEAFWLRHAFDSAQLQTLAPDARRWADLGAGAGFPGIVLAILLKPAPGVMVHLVESLAKRCRFLDEVVSKLGIPAKVHNARAESLRLDVDVVTARACAPMDRLLDYAAPSLRRSTLGLFLKGRGAGEELTAARRRWTFDAQLLPSRSGPDGRVVRIARLSRA